VPVDPATQLLIDTIASSGRKPLVDSTPSEARSFGPIMTQMIGPGPDVGWTEQATLRSDDGGSFEVRALVPEGLVHGVIVYYHGGGWVLGSLDQYDHFGRKLANGSSCAVVLVEYRKAPEHPYPAAVEDAWAALLWTADHAPRLAQRTVPLIVAGDSAGGNLAAVVAQRARDAQDPHLALQVLVYPVTDADFDTPSYTSDDNQLILTRESMQWFWNHYAPDPGVRTQPSASPARAQSLARLPPALVVLAEYDVLRDEGEEYAARLVADGVRVQTEVFAGQTHGFFTMVGMLPAHDAALDLVVQVIDREVDSRN
jgi:acetyl esterase